jgi:6-phosphofructokinase 1
MTHALHAPASAHTADAPLSPGPSSAFRRIGILTGGGDAPGLNAVIRAAVLTARNRYGWDVVGIPQGFDGLIAGAAPIPLDEKRVQDLLARGGTILGAVNRGNPFVTITEHDDGSQVEDASAQAPALMAALGLDAIIAAGGDGTMAIASKCVRHGARIVGVPKTIDNDLAETDVTFGFDTAILTATEALDKLQTTAESHHRVMILEVMGRNAGWIALMAGVAGGADAILIPEIPFDPAAICAHIDGLRRNGKRYSLIVVAEGASPVGGAQLYVKAGGSGAGRLGGIGHWVGEALNACVNAEIRVTVLGHLQRGGQPTPRDRWLATRFGAAAVELVAHERWGHMVALKGTAIRDVPMEAAIGMNYVDPAGEMVQMARGLGIVFGG